MRAFLYILNASSDPDRIHCAVPWRIDAQTIFFGPCKKRLRRWMKQNVLGTHQESVPNETLYVVGFNGANRKERKIVWAGKVECVMTFERAYNTLKGQKYEQMRNHPHAPLHLQPIEVEGRFGYRHISEEHKKKDAWIWDIAGRKQGSNFERRDDEIILLSGRDRQEVFNLDCCFLCENIFFARGEGIPITDKILDILQHVQPEEKIDPYAVFGRTKNCAANGLRGTYLEIDDKSQNQRLIDAIKSQASTLQHKGMNVDYEERIVCLRGCND
jgi:hypothetical protein